MRTVPILEVSLAANDTIVVVPDLPPEESFSHIYRADLGAEWLSDARALTVLPESKFPHLDAFRCILRAVSEEYGYALQLMPRTRWSGVPLDLQVKLQAVSDNAAA